MRSYQIKKHTFKEHKVSILIQLMLILLSPFFCYELSVRAQIIPDNTLPNNSTVIRDRNIIQITGGTITENNLFHSFQDFSVLKGQTAFFNNGLTIDNIVSRITGNSISHIDGLIGSNGSANLFLINPNGIIFGENAGLNIGGSFIATTANQIQLEEDGFFTISDLQSSQLLKIQPDVFLENALTNNQGTIINQGSLVVVDNLTLFASNLDLQGYLQATNLTLKATDTIQIKGTEEQPFRALAGANLLVEGLQGINIANSILTFLDSSHGVNITLNSLGSIALTDKTSINVRGAEGGNIIINAKNLEVSAESVVLAGIESNLGTIETQAGDIDLTIEEEIIIDRALIANSVSSNAIGNAGGINISTDSLLLTNGARIDASTSGRGNAGSVAIEATDKVTFEGKSFDGNPSGVLSRVNSGAVGNAGGVKISTDSLQALEGSLITASTFGQGNAGSVMIEATDRVTFDGRDKDVFPSGAFSQVGSNAIGDAGGVNISTDSLLLTNGARIDASTSGRGDAGSVMIEATDKVTFEGRDRTGNFSGAFSQVNSGAIGNAGGVKISTDILSVTDGASINASVFGAGKAGNINLEIIESIKLSGSNSGLFAITEKDARGNAGNILINSQTNSATELISIEENATIAVNNKSSGIGGNITLNTENITLKNASITAETVSEQGGNITLTANDILQLLNQENITASAGIEKGLGNGGNITINADFILAFARNNNHKITADANRGNGGNIKIATNSFFGKSSVDISASSQFGLNGDVAIDILEVDPARSLTGLASKIIDGSQIINKSCLATEQTEDKSNNFISTGRGGLPENPHDLLRGTAVLSADWISLPQTTVEIRANEETQLIKSFVSRTIIEARGWVIGANGNIVLTASSISAPNRNNPWSISPFCP